MGPPITSLAVELPTPVACPAALFMLLVYPDPLPTPPSVAPLLLLALLPCRSLTCSRRSFPPTAGARGVRPTSLLPSTSCYLSALFLALAVCVNAILPPAPLAQGMLQRWAAGHATASPPTPLPPGGQDRFAKGGSLLPNSPHRYCSAI
jgi:hypothetical protein